MNAGEMNVTSLKPLEVNDFCEFYRSLYGHAPFQWQSRLATQVCQGTWPDYMQLPTSSGKTAAIDIAVFSLAFQASPVNRINDKFTAARRIFFVVDRRIIVNEAFRRAKKMALALWNAVANKNPDLDSIQYRVAKWLQFIAASESAPPLDCFELRGGIFRNDAWVRSPLQPTVLASTVDQVGSRMLFRGYGVSDRNLPIHAALTTNDSLLILDEAHCSKPFSQTVEAIKRYRGFEWSEQPLDLPFALVQMTATPPNDLESKVVFGLDENADYKADEPLERRHGCSKPTRLVYVSGANSKARAEKLSKKLVEKALELSDAGCKKIAIVVNRVAIARAVFAELCKKRLAEQSELMIGRMRPYDREKLTEELLSRFGSGVDFAGEDAKFVVATQCLEVGADLDFDAMVTQCASLDALRQRFGRLNRLGNAPNCQGVIVAADGDVPDVSKLDAEKPIDPVYGNALALTWHWLNVVAGENGSIDFGIKAFSAVVATKPIDLDLSAPVANAPVLMPAHLDMLCQTNPRPSPEPDVALYLHGTNKPLAEVRVCWRADLELRPWESGLEQIASHEELWTDAVAACPPSSAELLSVPIYLIEKWLRGEDSDDSTSDVLGELSEESDNEAKRPIPCTENGRSALVWQGKRNREQISDKNRYQESTTGSFLVKHEYNLQRLHANATLVIPAEFGGWTKFGHVLNAPPEPSPDVWRKASDDKKIAIVKTDASETQRPLSTIDIAEPAFEQSRARRILRAHTKLERSSDTGALFDALLKRIKESSTADTGFRIQSVIDDVNDVKSIELRSLIRNVQKIERYPGGVVWSTKVLEEETGGMSSLCLASFGDDDTLLETSKVSLIQHLADVANEARRFCTSLLRTELQPSIVAAAELHDIGKADPRFQAMLLGKPLSVAWMQKTLWAKSEKRSESTASELPLGFRHEMLSTQLLSRFKFDDCVDREIVQHLVASHHGYACPMSPLWTDDTLPGFGLQYFGANSVTSDERRGWTPPWRLDSGVAERFWKSTRRFGWWGAAYLQTIVRLADWCASAVPNKGKIADLRISSVSPMESPISVTTSPSLLLTGIDGSRPLGFLAALGVFRILSTHPRHKSTRYAWCQQQGAWRPLLVFDKDNTVDKEDLISNLQTTLDAISIRHPSIQLSEFLASLAKNKRREAFHEISMLANPNNRIDVDWLSSLASDATDPEAISQLQTSRRDYHSIAIQGLIASTVSSHLRRTLFDAWDFADPIAGVSLHLEPREDRRHAYQWHTPSGDPTRKSSGGMIGANRLALEAWPLFQSLPFRDRLLTTGFKGLRANNTEFTWPIWTLPVPMELLKTILSLKQLQSSADTDGELLRIGIEEAFRSKRILVGKTPNLTSAMSITT